MFGPMASLVCLILGQNSCTSLTTFLVNEIVSRQEPHVNEDQLNIAVRIRDQAATPEIPSDGDPVLVEVIHKCLKADSKDRPVSR